MKNKMIDAITNAVDAVLVGMVLTLPLWIVAGVGSAVVGVMYVCK